MTQEPEAPLGASPDAEGTTFVVTSGVAERIELCLLDRDGAEHDRVDLAPPSDGSVRWHARVPGAGAGQRYGYRVHGPGAPSLGHACDPAKLLVDPAARKLVGELRWSPELTVPGVDSAPFVPRSVVVAPPSVPVPRPPLRSWDQVVAYEAHVGHLTARHPLVPAEDRGRYPGLAAPPVIDHLLRLGVTAVELLPVQHFVSESELVAAGRRNVWGYNPLAWGAPHAGYATAGGDAVGELRRAVAGLHEAGLEVWLDVVVNHTCEGSLGSGPILSWRGFDNAATYRLIAGEHGLVDDDVTGCGNAIDARSPVVRELIIDLLARWVREYGIDGFRFDLAATLIRGDDGPWDGAPLLAELAADERLAHVRLVAEPWDTGLGGYAVGTFPPPWRSWNDRARDDVRDLWRGHRPSWPTVATRLTGSPDLFAERHADVATAGINAVATHDGFTLADLVAYDAPLDGAHGQRSSNGGFDGPTADEAVLAARRRRQRALLGTVLLAQGVPMLQAGDELGRTQGGQANGYTLPADRWGVPWPEADWDLVAWTAAALDLRRRHPALRRPTWIAPGDPHVTWFTAAGQPFDDASWADPGQPGLQALLVPDEGADDRVLLLLAPEGTVAFHVPPGPWHVALDTASARGAGEDLAVPEVLEVPGPSLVVLVARP